MIFECIYDESECDTILQKLLAKEYEYHKPYLRFNKTVKVPSIH